MNLLLTSVLLLMRRIRKTEDWFEVELSLTFLQLGDPIASPFKNTDEPLVN